MLARVDEDILRRFHADILLLHAGWPESFEWAPRPGLSFTLPTTAGLTCADDGSWIIERLGYRLVMPPDGFFFDGGWPRFLDADPLDRLVRVADRIYRETDYATFYGQFNGYFSEDPEWLCQMLTAPAQLIAENRATSDADLERLAKLIDLLGDRIQGVWVVSDLGTQSGPMCRPSLYEQISAPFLRRLCSFLHSNSDWKVMLHSCGSIRPFLPLLIDCGIDGLNPVQISADDMDPVSLKSEFGDKVIFWGGGCNTQHVLNSKIPDEIAQNVRELVSVFKTNGGYVFSQVHNIMGDVSPEKIVKMFDTAYELSFY